MHVPRKDADGNRRYGRWAGNPSGESEDAERCIAEIPNPPSWTHIQCGRKRGHGPDEKFCKQHAKKATQQ